jgi:hypothetical protein
MQAPSKNFSSTMPSEAARGALSSIQSQDCSQVIAALLQDSKNSLEHAND